MSKYIPTICMLFFIFYHDQQCTWEKSSRSYQSYPSIVFNWGYSGRTLPATNSVLLLNMPLTAKRGQHTIVVETRICRTGTGATFYTRTELHMLLLGFSVTAGLVLSTRLLYSPICCCAQLKAWTPYDPRADQHTTACSMRATRNVSSTWKISGTTYLRKQAGRLHPKATA